MRLRFLVPDRVGNDGIQEAASFYTPDGTGQLCKPDGSCVAAPVVEVTSKTVFGYEALARGPEGTPFHSPVALFSTGQLLALQVLRQSDARDDYGKAGLDSGAGGHCGRFQDVEAVRRRARASREPDRKEHRAP